MKFKLTPIIFTIALFIFSNSFCQGQPVKSDSLTLALNKAKKENKKLYLILGNGGCSLCTSFKQYHNDPEVKKILSKYFEIAWFDIKTNYGTELNKKYGKPGSPTWLIFDNKGGVLVDSDNGKGNVGYPTKDYELEYYSNAVKKAAPNIKESDCSILVSKLKEYREKGSEEILKKFQKKPGTGNQ